MKIAILTLPLNNNYGGILQAYALRKYLIKKGHEVIHVEEKDKQSVVHWSSYRFNTWWYVRRFIRQVLSLKQDEKRIEVDNDRYQTRKNTNSIRRFVKDNFNILTVKDFRDLEKHSFDTIIVGSDQIWRPNYYKQIEDAFLSFAVGWDLKKITYAPSFGVENWEYNDLQTEHCVRLVKEFDAISTREDEGVVLCKEKLKVNAIRLLDPTMLLERSSYEAIVGEKVDPVPTQLTSYILDLTTDKKKIVDFIVKERKLKHIPLGLVGQKEKINDDSLENWLKAFLQAELVFTDSFHGCVFALLFHKPFVVFGNKNRGISIFNSLLRLFGLEDRLVQSTENVEDILNREIDWIKVDEVLYVERGRSALFFKEQGI